MFGPPDDGGGGVEAGNRCQAPPPWDRVHFQDDRIPGGVGDEIDPSDLHPEEGRGPSGQVEPGRGGG